MPVQFVGAGTAASGNNTGLTPALPSGLQPGDLLLAIFSARGNGTIGVPSGWSSRWEIVHTSSGVNKIRLLYKIYAPGDSAPTISYTGGSNGHTTLAQILAFRGVDPNNPFDTVGSASSNASAQNIGPITGITPQYSGACVLVIGHKADDCTSIATLSGDNLTWSRGSFVTSTASSDATQVCDFAVISGSPVQITSKTFTVTGGAAATGLGIMDSLRPALGVASASLPFSLSAAGNAAWRHYGAGTYGGYLYGRDRFVYGSGGGVLEPVEVAATGVTQIVTSGTAVIAAEAAAAASGGVRVSGTAVVAAEAAAAASGSVLPYRVGDAVVVLELVVDAAGAVLISGAAETLTGWELAALGRAYGWWPVPSPEGVQWSAVQSAAAEWIQVASAPAQWETVVGGVSSWAIYSVITSDWREKS